MSPLLFLHRLAKVLTALLFLFEAGGAAAWTSADISQVEVRVELNEEGQARVQTDARFVVNGGRFHGFDIAELSNAKLSPDECTATTDDGASYAVKLRNLRDGRTRIHLARKQSIKSGGVTFRIVHRVDMVEKGALRRRGDGVRLDWAPIVWDKGLEWMKVTVVLPPGESPPTITPDPKISKDYVITIDGAVVEFLKHRAPRWYEMQVALDTDSSRFASLAASPAPARDEGPLSGVEAAVSGVETSRASPPLWASVAPALGLLFGLLALILKHAHIHGISRQCGVCLGFAFLRNTSFGVRVALTLAAFALAFAAQFSQSIAASVPPLVAGSALWLVRRYRPAGGSKATGAWRRLGSEEESSLLRLARAYRAKRASFFDITSARGALGLGLFVLAPSVAALTVYRPWPFIGASLFVSALIPAVAVWLHAWDAELPQDLMMEQLLAFGRRRGDLCKLAGQLAPTARAELWIREGACEPVELRVRIAPLPKDVHRLEIAGEPSRCGSLQRMHLTAVIGLEPGSKLARQLAQSPLVCEHHLTPDLSEEVVVLRNRRGHRPNLAPLTSALAPLWR